MIHKAPNPSTEQPRPDETDRYEEARKHFLSFLSLVSISRDTSDSSPGDAFPTVNRATKRAPVGSSKWRVIYSLPPSNNDRISYIVRQGEGTNNSLFTLEATYPGVGSREMWELLARVDHRKIWDSGCEVAETVETFDECSSLEIVIEYFRQSGIFPVIKQRDTLLLSVNAVVSSRDQPLRIVSTSKSTTHNSKPPKKGYQRFHCNIGGFVLEELKEAQAVRVTTVYDVGELAKWTPSYVIKTCTQGIVPRILSNIRKHALSLSQAEEREVTRSSYPSNNDSWLPPWFSLGTEPTPVASPNSPSIASPQGLEEAVKKEGLIESLYPLDRVSPPTPLPPPVAFNQPSLPTPLTPTVTFSQAFPATSATTSAAIDKTASILQHSRLESSSSSSVSSTPDVATQRLSYFRLRHRKRSTTLDSTFDDSSTGVGNGDEGNGEIGNSKTHDNPRGHESSVSISILEEDEKEREIYKALDTILRSDTKDLTASRRFSKALARVEAELVLDYDDDDDEAIDNEGGERGIGNYGLTELQPAKYSSLEEVNISSNSDQTLLDELQEAATPFFGPLSLSSIQKPETLRIITPGRSKRFLSIPPSRSSRKSKSKSSGVTATVSWSDTLFYYFPSSNSISRLLGI